MPYWGFVLCGLAAGSVNGLFGAGGGMVLVPMLTALTDLDEEEIFPASVSIILPVCLVTLTMTLLNVKTDWNTTLYYLIGSATGGILAGLFGKKIPAKWLHKLLGLLILWGGIRYLC